MAYDLFAGTNKLKKKLEGKLQNLGAEMRKEHEAKKNTYYGRTATFKEGVQGLKEVVQLARKKNKKKTWE